MPPKRRRTAQERLLRQWRLVDALTERKRGATTRQLLEATGASRATVYRDLEVLLQSPLPLTKENLNGEVRYRLESNGWPGLLTPRQGMALVLARKALMPLEGASFLRELDALLARAMPEKSRIVVEGKSRQERSITEALDKAIATNVRVTMGYQATNEAESRSRTVEPVELRVQSGALYLTAYDLERAGWRTFKVARVSSVELTAVAATAHPPFDSAQVYRHAVGIWSGEPVDVRIRIAPERARLVAEYPLSEDQVVTLEPATGAAEVAARVSGTFEVVKWILSWGRHAKVLGPPELVDAVRAELEATLGSYRNGR